MAKKFDWARDRSEIEFHISSNISPLKVGLKTKDEAFFLRDWVEHHRKIVGPGSIFIADNGSTDPAVLEYYSSLPEDICIFGFKGLHNDLHDRRMYPELHSSLFLSSSYFQILDTDERLVWLNRDHYIADHRLVENLLNSRPMEAAFGIWLSNVGGESDQFLVGPKNILLSAIQWGKSLFSAGRMMPIGQRLHNCQLPKTVIETFDYTPNVCVLHLKNLSQQHMLRSIKSKLVARKAILPAASYDEISTAELQTNALPGSRYYHKRFISLYQGQAGWEFSPLAKEYCIKLESDGSITFASEKARSMYNGLFTQPGILAKEAFSQYADLKPE